MKWGEVETPCGLSDDELAVLFYLVTKRATSEKKSRYLPQIEDDLEDQNIEAMDVLNSLILKGYVGCKKKGKSKNYYVSLGDAQRALEDHNYPVWRGGRGPI